LIKEEVIVVVSVVVAQRFRVECRGAQAEAFSKASKAQIWKNPSDKRIMYYKGFATVMYVCEGFENKEDDVS
jgi:hypothetical protein